MPQLANQPRTALAVGCIWAMCAGIVALAPLLLSVPAVAQSASTAATTPFAVTTYHYDALRTGWNADEHALTPAGVASPAFQLLRTVVLDDEVDAQPLIVPRQTISGYGTRNVAYVVTANNTIYAIDTDTGAILRSVNLGPPAPLTLLPGQCAKNSDHVGINSTPVIDLSRQVMYLIALTYENGGFIYRIHALDLATLADQTPAVVVAAHHKLVDGTTVDFIAKAERQRAALLRTKGAIYAGFASFCDHRSDVSRGWVLGWHAGSLKPLYAAELLDRLATAPNDVFLSAVWMSGYGIAADPSDNLYFVTGNSDFSGTTYNSKTNLSESVVKLAPGLSPVLDFFTPSGTQFGVAALDMVDDDFGSGGVLLLPPQPGSIPNLAVAAGKVGQMYLLNRDSLGGHAAGGPDKVLGVYQIGPCFCGQSYFTGADGIGRIVSSGGSNAIVWKVQTAPTPALIQESVSAAVASRLNRGFFTTISSNGTKPGTAVIWAIAGPVDKQSSIMTLYAFNAANGASLATMTAGTWQYLLGAANTVPVVANGQVYVGSYKQLAIFGLAAGASHAAIARFPPAPQMLLAQGQHEIFGTVRAAAPGRITVETRDGRTIELDPTPAERAKLSAVAVVGRSLRVRGAYLADGRLSAATIESVPALSDLWPDDR